MINNLYTVKEAASISGIEYKTLLKRISCGTVRATHSGIGRSFLIEPEEVERLRSETHRPPHKFKGTNRPRGNSKPRRSYRAYKSYRYMLGQCYNLNHKAYSHYGGSGITVCDRWRDSFENFLEDMGERPEGLTLNRKNLSGNFEPGNCKWSARS